MSKNRQEETEFESRLKAHVLDGLSRVDTNNDGGKSRKRALFRLTNLLWKLYEISLLFYQNDWLQLQVVGILYPNTNEYETLAPSAMVQ